MKVGDTVCLWFELQDEGRMGTPAVVDDIREDGAVLVSYMVLGEYRSRWLSEGQARTQISKYDKL